MSQKRTIRVRFTARDENDPKALYEVVREAIEKKTGQKLPELPAASETVAEPPTPKVSDEVAESVVRQAAAEVLDKKAQAIESGQQPDVPADPKTLEEKTNKLQRWLRKGATAGAMLVGAKVVEKVIDWGLALVARFF